MGPLVTIEPDGCLYTRVKPADVAEIVKSTLIEGTVVERLLYADPVTGDHCHGTSEIPFYTRQARTVLKACGTLDPEDISEYIHSGGYASAKKAFTEMTPQSICEDIIYAGCAGVGAAGSRPVGSGSLRASSRVRRSTSSATR